MPTPATIKVGKTSSRNQGGPGTLERLASTNDKKPSQIVIWTVLPACAAALSILIQGFQFGIGNNVYHVPVVLEHYLEPSFAADAMYQSLRNFTSGIWVALRVVTTEENISHVYLATHFLARWLLFAAALWLGYSNGIRRAVPLAGACALFAFTPLVYNFSHIGWHDMLTNYFSHTEIANALVLTALVANSRGNSRAAYALNGLVLITNVFVGVWTAVALASGSLAYTDRDQTQKQRLLNIGTGSVIMFAIALPIIIWTIGIVSSSSAGVAPFNYPAFLDYYFPQHFFSGSASAFGVATMAAVVASGIGAVFFLPGRRVYWLSVLGGLLLVFAAGSVAPILTSSPLILNLHLLRVDGIVYLVVAAIVATVAVRGFTVSTVQAKTGGIFALASMATYAIVTVPSKSLTLAFGVAQLCLAGFAAWRIVMGTATRHMRLRDDRAVYWVVAAMAALSLTAGIRHVFASRSLERPSPEWVDIQRWARGNTPADALFLVPVRPQGFQLGAHRRIWVDWKQGAAVMWQPSFYWQWKPRHDEVSFLETEAEYLWYACEHEIEYVIAPRVTSEDALQRLNVPAPLYSNPEYSAFRVRPDDCRAVHGLP